MRSASTQDSIWERLLDKHFNLLPSLQNGESFRKARDEPRRSPTLTSIFPFMTFAQPSHLCFQDRAQMAHELWIILHPHENPLKGLWKPSTYSGWGRWPTKSWVQTIPQPFFNHFLSPRQLLPICNMKNQKECIWRGRFIVHFEGFHVSAKSIANF